VVRYQSVVSSAILELLSFAWSAATVHVRGCTGTTVSAILTHITYTHAPAAGRYKPNSITLSCWFASTS